MAQKCTSCQKEISDETFCPHCGASQHCPKCKTNFIDSEKICKTCGEKRESSPQTKEDKTTNIMISKQDQYTERPRDRQTGLKKIPPIFWALGLVVVLIVSYIILSGSSDEKAIEQTITNYIEAMEGHDLESMYTLTHPNTDLSQDEIGTRLEYLPVDIEINIDHFFGWEIFDQTASVQAVIHFKSELHNVQEKNDVTFKLKKEGKQWLIYDTYE